MPAEFKHARYALWKNPDNLTERQRDKLAWIAKTDPRLHRAYLLKEGLRYVFTRQGRGRHRSHLDRWLSWAAPLPHPAPSYDLGPTHHRDPATRSKPPSTKAYPTR